jgi:hypothetical protein
MRPRCEFNLKEVSWEHIGLSRNYKVANLKRKMLPGIQELEAKGFITAQRVDERFRKVSSGEWRVVFERAKKRKPATVQGMTSEKELLKTALIDRGVTPSTSEETVSNFPSEQISNQLEVFDWLMSKQDSKVMRNPAGFLISSIKSEYLPPAGFVSQEERARRDQEAAARKAKAQERAEADAEREKTRQQAKANAIDSYWSSLSEEERALEEVEAMKAASPIQRELIERGGAFAKATKQSILNTYALNALKAAA